MTNDRRGDAAGLVRELAAQVAALATPEPNAPSGTSTRRAAPVGRAPSLAGPRAILENAARFAQPVLPADARFRSLKALVLRALRIVTRDQGVFNSAVHEALRATLVETEAALAGLAASHEAARQELGEAVREGTRIAETARGESEKQRDRLDAARAELLSDLERSGEALRGALDRESSAREELGRELLASQKRIDAVEVRSDEAGSRLADAGTRLADAQARLAETETRLARVQADLARASEDLRAARLEWTTLRTELRPGAAAPAAAGSGFETRSAADPISAGLYADFERAFRGAEEEIRRRQEGDVGLFAGVTGPVADLGCGRGEFLEALAAHGIAGVGCDTNPVMVARCREKNLAVEEADLFGWLRAQREGSLGGVTAYQVVEHLPADALLPLVELAVSRLAPGGRLLLETVNAESVYAMKWFWMDLTHVRPVPAPSLGRLMEACGLRDVTIAYRSPVPPEVAGGATESADPLVGALARLVFADQDVAVTGVK